MFWKFDLHPSSHLDTLLEREGLSLRELLDEEDVLQECKGVNRKLLDFLLQPQHLEAMVASLTQEPPADGDERLRYKYPSVSCDILTADVPQINDALGGDEALLRQLYGFLQAGGNLNPLLASFFSKVMGVLINRKADQIVSFLQKKDDFVPLLLRHIGTSAIMDLLLRLLTCVEGPRLRQHVFTWLNEEKIVQRLIEMIHPSKDESQHSNAAQSLCDIVRLSREQMIHIQDSPEPDQLLATLEKQETVEQLLSNMFEGEQQSDSVVICGIQVLLTLLEPLGFGSGRGRQFGGLGGFYCTVDGQLELTSPVGRDALTSQASLGTLLALRPRLRHFHQLLLQSPKKEVLRTTWGMLEPPLGAPRLHAVMLLGSALTAPEPGLREELLDLDTLNTLLDLYFHYVYNNFLHSQVELCISNLLSSGPPGQGDGECDTPTQNTHNAVVKHLLQRCRLVQRVLSAWEENDRIQAAGGRRQGYMGHLTRMANAVVQSMEAGPNAALLGQLLRELPTEEQERWETFVSGPLAETNRRNRVDLVSAHPRPSSSEDEDDPRLKEFAFPEEAALQQAFMDFQMQQMTSAFIDHFGFNDEEFGEQEENPNSNLFEICCKERIRHFDDDEEESDGEAGGWEDKPLPAGAQSGPAHGLL
uniref:Protein phosphatase 6 regulatory subunit 1 n=1 Tax=Ornithorhynchus anatinus TaxID=9258 RepID=A0A6I8PE55_ORNAN